MSNVRSRHAFPDRYRTSRAGPAPGRGFASDLFVILVPVVWAIQLAAISSIAGLACLGQNGASADLTSLTWAIPAIRWIQCRSARAGGHWNWPVAPQHAPLPQSRSAAARRCDQSWRRPGPLDGVSQLCVAVASCFRSLPTPSRFSGAGCVRFECREPHRRTRPYGMAGSPSLALAGGGHHLPATGALAGAAAAHCLRVFHHAHDLALVLGVAPLAVVALARWRAWSCALRHRRGAGLFRDRDAGGLVVAYAYATSSGGPEQPRIRFAADELSRHGYVGVVAGACRCRHRWQVRSPCSAASYTK